jgi:hypothetical protein
VFTGNLFACKFGGKGMDFQDILQYLKIGKFEGKKNVCNTKKLVIAHTLMN